MSKEEITLGTCQQQFSHDGSVPHAKQGNCDDWVEIHTTCFTCGQAWERENSHDCPMKDKLTPQEQEICGAMLVASGCDHYCCGLSPVACQAKTIAHFLNKYETDHLDLFGRAMTMLKALNIVITWELAPSIKKEIAEICQEFENMNNEPVHYSMIEDENAGVCWEGDHYPEIPQKTTSDATKVTCEKCKKHLVEGL